MVIPFEGVERKVEIVLDDGLPSLREWPPERWSEIISIAGAGILSVLRTPRCDAYLLSASSLFVFDHSFVMITCGDTTLVDAVEIALSGIDPGDVNVLIYERKKERFHTDPGLLLDEDVRRLSRMFPGQIHSFGEASSQPVSLFVMEKPFRPAPSDMTLEILMHGLRATSRDRFVGGADRRPRAAGSGLGAVFEGFTIDDHYFEPQGYSLNAVRSNEYYTVHVTPETPGSFASFETTVPLTPRGIESVVHRVLRVFEPEFFDLLVFRPTGADLILPGGYEVLETDRARFACGYDVQFLHGVPRFHPDEVEWPERMVQTQP